MGFTKIFYALAGVSIAFSGCGQGEEASDAQRSPTEKGEIPTLPSLRRDESGIMRSRFYNHDRGDSVVSSESSNYEEGVHGREL